MRKLFLAALLAGCGAVPAQAMVSIGVVSQLEYEQYYIGAGGEWITEHRGSFAGTIEFTSENWDSLFDTNGTGPFNGCRSRGEACITARLAGNTLSFSGSDLLSYDGFSLTLIFDRNIADYSEINPNNFLSGSFDYSSMGHSGGSSLSGPVLYIAYSEPGEGPALNNAVPEPATWALMIGGFALAGAAMRRRSYRVAFG